MVAHLVDERLSNLQYDDYTILFVEHDIKKTNNLTLIYSAFEQLWGLNINLCKSDFFFNVAQDNTNLFADFFWLRVRLFSYLIFWYYDSLSETYKR
jgi:hypothetical protein